MDRSFSDGRTKREVSDAFSVDRTNSRSSVLDNLQLLVNELQAVTNDVSLQLKPFAVIGNCNLLL